jgi:RimJ/RimL family protein N-acetyltransferase
MAQTSAACGLLQKAGLRQEGEFVQSWFDGHAWVNVSWYALLNEEPASHA